MKRYLSLLALPLFFLSACDKEDLDRDLTQPVVFQYEYVNHAWGFSHAGWMIDTEGNVKGFNLPENWNKPDQDGFISKEDLVENLAMTDTLYARVDNSKLLRHFGNRFDMLKGRMDTSDQNMADAGVGSLLVYVWNEKEEAYETVLLASKGDVSVTNKSTEAKSAVSWLKSVGEETDRFFWFD